MALGDRCVIRNCVLKSSPTLRIEFPLWNFLCPLCLCGDAYFTSLRRLGPAASTSGVQPST